MKLTNDDIERFLTGSRNFAKITQKSRRYKLRAFTRWLGDRDFDEDSVREYAETHNKPSTYNSFIGIVKSLSGWKMKRLPQEDFGAYIRDRQVLELIKDIRPRRIVTQLVRREFYMEELQKIFGALEGVKFSGLWCLAWFGCRPGELVDLQFEHINKQPDKYLPPLLAKELRPDEYCIKFLTEKTKVERALFMDEFTKGHLERFIESGCDYHFLWETCVKLRNKVGVEFTPKMFRSNFVTKMQRTLMVSKTPMVEPNLLVKVMSGHTVSQDITVVYTSYGTDIKRAMTELHFMKPLEGGGRSSFNESNYRAILEYVAGAPGATTKDVSQALNLSRPNATRGLSQMGDLGYLHAEKRIKGRGRPSSEYYLTENGREKLRSIVGGET